MRNVFRYIVLSLISLFITIPVYAEETCDYKMKATLNKYAYNVEAGYEIKKREDGTSYFVISIYNIVDEIFVNYRSELEGNASIGTNVNAASTTNGTYKFEIPVPDKPFNYIFVVKSGVAGCAMDLRTFKKAIPVRNKYHDLDYCKRSEMEDYHYCQEWITEEFSSSNGKDIETKIKERYQSIRNNQKTKCIGCEEEARNKNKIAKFNNLKKQVIIGLIIGIVLDIVIMSYQIFRIRRDEI